MKKLFGLTLALYSLHGLAADTALITPNSISNTSITKETILSLSPQLPQRIEDNRAQMNNWLAQNYSEPSQYKGSRDGNRLFPLEQDKPLMLKVSGVPNKFFSAAHSYDDLDQGRIWSDHSYQQQIFARTQQSGTCTYQNASRLAFSLIKAEAICNKNLNLIGVPETYLYSTDGTSVDDNHTVIIQDKIDALPLEKRLRDGYIMSDNQIKQLCAIIEAVGFWNPAQGNTLVDKDNKMWLLGQQPNNSRPQDFFYQADHRYHGNIVCGYKDKGTGLRNIFEINPRTRNLEAWRAIMEYARESDTFHASNFTEGYKNAMLDFIKKQEDK